MQSIRADVEKVLKKIRPMLQADGGDIELLSVKNDVVKVKLRGACATCPFAFMTLQNVVEVAIKEKIPSIKKVEAEQF